MKPVRRVVLLAIAMVTALIPAAPGVADAHESLVISGVVDGPLTGGIPKAIELTALADIPDLSVYGVESANNGGGAVGPEFTFPADSLSAGDVVYLASESTAFEAFFCAAPDYTGGVANINGDDAIALYTGGAIVDVFGEVNVDGTGESWEYLDGWAKRNDGTGPDGSTFEIANWAFSGINALDGETRNDLAATPYPFEGVSDCPEPEPEFRLIHEIQGSGAESPLVGDRVIIEGIVVGDFETFGSLAGFFVQEEDADADADLATSEGVFVFNFSNDTVNVGDVVRVEGTVEERFGNTQLTDFVEITKLGEGAPLPNPAIVSFPLTSVDDLEAYEGMNARFPQTLSIIEYFNFDRFGETVVGFPLPGEDRHYQPTAVYEPGSVEAAELASYNARSRITIDDGRTSQNPDPAIHPGNGEVFDLDNRFNGGDTITGITGAIYYTFDLYRIMPTEYGEYVAANPRDLVPEEVGGDLKIATLNALNYFSTIDTGIPACGPNLDQDCRGADDENERQRQLTKLTEALIGMDADIVGLIEVENTAGVEPLEDIVESLNAQLGKDTYRYVKAGENSVVGTDAIKVGIIYKKASVVPNAEPAILDDPSFLDPRNLGDDKNRAALAQTFNQKGTGEKVTVVVNHLKSKGSGCGEGDDDPEQGSCNLTRTLAAQALLDWIDADPTHMNDPDFLIIGDLNSYDREDPIDVLRAGGYADLLFEYQGGLAYSYLFGGALGYLDYGMSSTTLTPQVTGATAWHINSDEPDILDYDTSFKKDAQDALFEENAFRSSDHDAVIIGLDLNRKLGR
jgi:predicted extracellular nuclease